MALPLKLPYKQLIVGAAAAAIGIWAWLVLFPSAAAPQVQFPTLAGETVSTADLRGKVVLVNFWATSCVSCVAEMPKIVETYEKYRDRGFETVAVAMSYDPPNHVLAYAVNNRLPFKVAFDPVGNVARSFGGVEATPTTFVLDRRGKIVERFVGEPDFARLHELLESKLREPV
jgi:peroxiredoxin